MHDSLASFFLETFQKNADEIAYRQRRGYRTESFTYRGVLQLAFGVARALGTRGISKGERVILWGRNSAEWVAAFFGCVMSGVAVVPMDDAGSADFVMRVARQVTARLMIISRAHQHELAASSIPSFAFDEITPAPAAPHAVAMRDADVLQIVFTSGTTADPKGVVITHGNVLANIAPLEREMQPYRKYERLVHPLRFLNLLPLSHVFGQFLGMYLPPLLGGTVVFQDELKPSDAIDTIRRERVSVLVSVPRVLQSLKQKIERDLETQGRLEKFRRRFAAAKDRQFLLRWWIFHSIRRQFGWKFWAFISGGAALDSEAEEFWGRLGYAVIQGYGLTETTSLISVNHPFRLGKGSIGKVLPGRDVKLAPDGEILVRGGGVASGYWQGGSTHAVADEQGWYRTGDIGALDAEGNLYFKGRKKDVIVTPAGLNVYPDDLEAALRHQPEVKDCVVVGLERGGNSEPCAILILRDQAEVAAVVQRANGSLAEYQRVHLWMLWPEQDFPRTGTQKPRRNAIAEVARACLREPAATADTTTGSPLGELISRITGRSASNLRSDASLDADLGLSSLDRVDLLSVLEDRYQVDLSESRFSTLQTVGDLERMLRGETWQSKAYHYPRWVLRWPITWIRVLTHYLLMRPAVLLLGWPRIVGRENLDGVKGPLLVVANHIGDVDLGFILTALPARLRNRLATAAGGEAMEALRTAPVGRPFLLRLWDRAMWIAGASLLNLFPLPREAGFRQSFAYAGEAVDRGYSVLVFPEGRHTQDGKVNPFRAGIGLLAQNLGIPVLPMRIDGLFEYKQAGKKFAPPFKITVRIGTPMTFSPTADPKAIAHELQDAVESL